MMLQTEDGSAVAIRENRILETRDAKGRLLFEYDVVTGSAVVHLAGALRVRAGEVDIEARRGVRIASGESEVTLSPVGIEGTAPRVSAKAQDARFAWGSVEHLVGRLRVWARSVYERVEGLFHTRAERVRVEADDHLVQAGSATVVAQDDVRIDGKSINLG